LIIFYYEKGAVCCTYSDGIYFAVFQKEMEIGVKELQMILIYWRLMG